jgi:hypothetical protein
VWGPADIEEVFGDQAEITDLVFWERLKESTAVWVSDSEGLDFLEDTMTVEDAMFLVTDREEILIPEYDLFNALASAYNNKIAADITYLRARLLEVTSGDTIIQHTQLAEIFVNKRERKILFPNSEPRSVETVLRRVFKYLEGDVVVRTDKRGFKATVS